MNFIKVTIQVNYKDSEAFINANLITIIIDTNDVDATDFKTVVHFGVQHRINVRETKKELLSLINSTK